MGVRGWWRMSGGVGVASVSRGIIIKKNREEEEDGNQGSSVK